MQALVFSGHQVYLCQELQMLQKKKKEIESKLLQQTFAYFSHQSYGPEGKEILWLLTLIIIHKLLKFSLFV